jgi:hypothetical protein
LNSSKAISTPSSAPTRAWTWGSADFVFNRRLICGITDWPLYMQKVLWLLRPGGWAEMQDLSYVWYRNGRVCSD